MVEKQDIVVEQSLAVGGHIVGIEMVAKGEMVDADEKRPTGVAMQG